MGKNVRQFDWESDSSIMKLLSAQLDYSLKINQEKFSQNCIHIKFDNNFIKVTEINVTLLEKLADANRSYSIKSIWNVWQILSYSQLFRTTTISLIVHHDARSWRI